MKSFVLSHLYVHMMMCTCVRWGCIPAVLHNSEHFEHIHELMSPAVETSLRERARQPETVLNDQGGPRENEGEKKNMKQNGLLWAITARPGWIHGFCRILFWKQFLIGQHRSQCRGHRKPLKMSEGQFQRRFTGSSPQITFNRVDVIFILYLAAVAQEERISILQFHPQEVPEITPHI